MDIFILNYIKELSECVKTIENSDKINSLNAKLDKKIEELNKKTVRTMKGNKEEQENELVNIANQYKGNKQLLEDFMELFRQQNKSGKMSIITEIKKIKEILWIIKKDNISFPAFDKGMEVCLTKDISNINYARKVAQKEQQLLGKSAEEINTEQTKQQDLLNSIWTSRREE